ncbi:MAG: endonuclease/exonuclease/phosphatase family protein [Pedobacter sp.]|uniref:endonuclease/exonuclease/phosphatase family protein n=1 Tax=Pedobacter sp. TaxID=1411316 RepID=UPI00356721AC
MNRNLFRIYTLLLLSIAMFSSCKKVYEKQEKKSLVPFYYATYNIRTDTDTDVDNPWTARRELIADMVVKHGFELFGIQEGKDNQVADLAARLPQFKHFGAGRNNGLTGEHVEIFYRNDLFEVLETGDFWLSPKPESPGPGWDASLNRICTWGRFKQLSTGTEFYVFNTHIDHQGAQAQRESTKLLLNMIPKIAGNYPALLSGDFNYDQNGDNYRTLNTSSILRDCYTRAENPNAPNGTLNLFDIYRKTKARIDHVFITPQFNVEQYDILIDTYNGKIPSDHYPVRVKLSM